MSACGEFTQNAWRRGLCANCQRPSGEHICQDQVQNNVNKPCPVPAKRNSTVLKCGNMVLTQEDHGTTCNNGTDIHDKSDDSGEVDNISNGEISGNDRNEFDIDQMDPMKSSLAVKKENTRLTKVFFANGEPLIIGYDGGIDNFFIDPEEESLSDSVSSGEELSFTEEEKGFVLLALENTLWNSNVQNLQLDTDSEQTHKTSHEFEDVDLQSLWKAERFSTLKDCDACHLSRRYGTFPLRSKGAKIRIKTVTRTSSDIELNRIAEDPSENVELESYGSGSEQNKLLVTHSSLLSSTSLSSEGDHPQIQSCDSVGSYSCAENTTIDVTDGEGQNIISLTANNKTQDDLPCDLEMDLFEDIDLNSSSAGMDLVDLINDVLSRYSDSETLKKIETFELEPDEDIVSVKKDESEDSSSKSNKLKSKTFEAKMASLAANLNLSKQRAKRPAPRPPSPPTTIEPISPKKSPVHLPEPNFKMAPLGRLGGPYFERPSSPEPCKSTSTDEQNNENMEGVRLKSENKPKKGLTSFFKNILRRSRDSVEMVSEKTSSTESLQPQNRETFKETAQSVSDKKFECEPTSPEKMGSKYSPQLKTKVLPPITKPPRTNIPAGISTLDVQKQLTSSSVEQTISDTVELASSPKSENPHKEPKGSCSPALKHKENLGTPPKPPIASKPKSSQNQPALSDQTQALSSSHSEDSKKSSPENKPKNIKEGIFVRRRTKSPKRIAAPVTPSRQSMPCKATEQRNPVFTKELEMKLSKAVEQNKTPTKKSETKKNVAPQPPSSPVSPTDEMEEIDKFPNTSTEDIVENIEQEQRTVEKIELPKAAQTRRSFLGKLGGNRKSRPPPPPSVKRTKSITESSLPLAEMHAKKIDVKDISGPVLIANISSGRVVHRRNTITLGDDCAFMSGGSTSSGSTVDRSDETQDLSPLGSFDNLYEDIIPKSHSQASLKPNYYDPIDSRAGQSIPNKIISIEGYLEPVRTVCTADSQAVVIPNADVPKTSTLVPTKDDNTESVPQDDTIESHEVVVSDARKRLLASQPIYEEINGYCKDPFAMEQEPMSPTMKLSISTVDSPAENILPDMQSPIPSPRSKDSHMSMSESESSSATSTLSRPKPTPRRHPKKGEVTGVEQYVAMNRPSVAVTLNEEQLREMINTLTSMNLQTLREIYTLQERTLIKENLKLIMSGPLKWVDFDIYGKPIHTSERCIAYNARLKISSLPCQLLLLHTRPEITSAHHPSLLKPTVVFTDNIPFSYLPEDFIKTSQLLQNSAAQSSIAKCYIAVGMFDIADSMSNSLHTLRNNIENKGDNYIELVLLIVLQLLSAVSHCLDQGYVLVEADFRDTFVVSSSNCMGHIVAFLPHKRSHENSQAAIVCNFLEKFLQDFVLAVLKEATATSFYFLGIKKMICLLQPMKMEALAAVRTYTEHMLWGPKEGESEIHFNSDNRSNLETKLSMWLERERASLIHTFSKVIPGTASMSTIQEFYKMKFLLKSSSSTLADCIINHFST